MFRVRLLVIALVVMALLLTSAPASAAPPSWVAGCSQYHVVQWGENLFRIALRYGTNYYSLMQLNGIYNPNFVWAGQYICVAGGGYYPGGSPSSGGHGDGYIGYDTPYGFKYCVKAGDTLTGIAARYGWSVSYLAAVNGISNWNWLYTDMYLLIPHHY